MVQQDTLMINAVGQSVTPQTGTSTLTVDTTLSPSLLSITGHIKETV